MCQGGALAKDNARFFCNPERYAVVSFFRIFDCLSKSGCKQSKHSFHTYELESRNQSSADSADCAVFRTIQTRHVRFESKITTKSRENHYRHRPARLEYTLRERGRLGTFSRKKND